MLKILLLILLTVQANALAFCDIDMCRKNEGELRKIAWNNPDAYDFDRLMAEGTFEYMCNLEPRKPAPEWMTKKMKKKLEDACDYLRFYCMGMGK